MPTSFIDAFVSAKNSASSATKTMWVLVPVWTEAQPNICSKAHKDYGMDLRQDRTKIMTPGRDLDPSVRIQGHPLIICS